MLKPGKNKVSFILSTTQVSYVQLAVTVSFTLEAESKRVICVCVLCVHMCVSVHVRACLKTIILPYDLGRFGHM